MHEYNKPVKVTAIVPMRKGSERVPGKNFRDFGGKPLYHTIITELLKCSSFTSVVIDTDSEQIIEDASRNYPDVVTLERPSALGHGTTPMNSVLMSTISRLPESDFYLQTHSTNPLLKAGTIDSAVNFYTNNFPSYDSLFGVTRLQTRLWDQLGLPINHNPAILLRTQDLPPTYEENSCFYLFTKEVLEKKLNRIGDRPYLWEVPRDESFDIDEEIDFEIAEFLYQKRQQHGI